MQASDPRFPVLQMRMNDHCLTLSLADEHSSHQVTLPKDMMDGLMEAWKKFQDGTATEPFAIGRYYTGTWPKEAI